MTTEDRPPLWAPGDPSWVAADPEATETAEEEEHGKRKRNEQAGEEEGEGKERGGTGDSSEDVWFMHRDLTHWLVNPREGVYFNRTTGELVPAAGGEGEAALAGGVGETHPGGEGGEEEEEGEEEEGREGEEEEGREGEEEEGREEEEGGDEEEEEDEDIDLDLETDVVAGTAERKGSAEGKVEIEDRHVTKVPLPVQVVTGDANALCYYTAIFDGHDGSSCAQYATVHLHKNLISLYRQIYSTVQRRRQELEAREEARERGAKKRQKRPSNFSLLLQQLNDGLPCTRREEKFLSVGLEALVKATAKSFFMTDHNFLDHAQKAGVEQDAGSTACVVLLFGPDDDGQLKLLTAHAGDTRAVLCRDDRALRLTEDHRPNDKFEKRRIQQNGGEVMNIEGIWRVVFVDRKTNRLFGLATSRALGDRRMKIPKKLVSCQPSLHVYAINFETDLFMVLASDGIWDVLSDEEVVAIVSEHLDKPPQEAARVVIDEAVKRGSEDDKTCTVVYFKWRRDRFQDAAAEAQTPGAACEGARRETGDTLEGDARKEANEGESEGGSEGDRHTAAENEGCSRRARQRGDEASDTSQSGASERKRRKLRTQPGTSSRPEGPESDTGEGEDNGEGEGRGDSRSGGGEPHAESGEGEEAPGRARGEGRTETEGDSFKAGRGLEDIGLLSSSNVYERIRREREERAEKEEEVAEEEEDLDIFSA
nr:TPA: GTP-binding protein, related [Neospora caninum Liverpool]